MRSLVLSVIACVLASRARGGYNGLAQTPPMGWRSWNEYAGGCDQTCLEGIARALVDTSRTVNGSHMSLLQLGYNTVGLDDSWQACGKGYSPLNYTFHNASSFPLVNSRFPDMRALTATIHSLSLRAGWYQVRQEPASV